MNQTVPNDYQLSNTDEAITRWADTVWRVVCARLRNKHDAEDAFQNTFLALCRSNPHFESLEHQKAWLLRVACNCCNQILRERMLHPHDPLDEVDHPAASPTTNDDELDQAIRCLTPYQQIIVHLFYFEGYSTDEIGTIIGVKPATVRSALHRARLTLKLKLTKQQEVCNA